MSQNRARQAATRDAMVRAADFLERGEADEAARALLVGWVGSITGEGFQELDALCMRLPASYVDDPRFLAIRACAQDALGADSVARMLLARAHAVGGDSLRYSGLDWHLAFADMVLLDGRAEVAAASERAWELYCTGAELDQLSRTAALHHMGWAYLRHRYNPDRGIQILGLAMRESAALGDYALSRRAARQLACMLAWSGRLREARRLLLEIEEEPDDHIPWKLNTEGAVAAATSTLAYWTSDVGLAKSTFALLSGGDRSVVSFAATARMMLMLSAASARDSEMTRRAKLELQSIPAGTERGLEWETFREMLQAVLAEATGNRERAVSIARRHIEQHSLPLVGVVLAGILRRAGKASEALQILQRLQQYQQLSFVRVAALATAAVVHYQNGRVQVAHELCEHALSVATTEDIRRPFCERDLDLRKLVTEHLAWGTQFETFIAECLTDETGLGRHQALTPRERAVVAQLRTTRTMPEIAEELGVSVNTVKTQVKSIYRRLGVASRRDAVSRLASDTN